MGNISQNNKRIAQNTFLLYVRMFITLTVSLFTSRIVLEKLGVEDYGIYNVVAGLVSMFTFMNGTLATGTQRFITFSLGENNFKKSKLTFSTTLIIHIILSLIIGIAIFVGGLYFLKEELVISADRMDAAYWVFYCSVLTVMLNITQVPYMASIIAHEDMSIYAYMSIFDAVAKLGVAYALVIVDVDKMKLYAVLIALVQVCDVFYYRYHCIRKYKECHFEVRFDKPLAKEILQFSSWNIFGCTSVLFNNQGFNILLNIFYGPVLNAARGISNQVNNVASQFVGSFQTAVNPQIVKYYAEKDIERMNRLIYHNARFSGLMILYIMVPLMIELPFLLSLWLGKYPDDTVFLTRIILIQTLIASMSRSVVMGIHAIGKMKMVNLLAGTTLLLSLPISFVLFKMSISLEIVMVITLLPWFIETFIELTLMKKYVGLSRRKFYIQSYGIIILIGGIMCIPLLVISSYMNEGYIRFLVNMSISTVLGGILIYCFGITANMRVIINDKIKSLINK
ncbi:lipopolysaccharide biosynthesis protein [Phocaeicola sartorii]|uniref:Lipopolysaccharide biosynthesis protein n=1 Tax=Phocaeicola sartorii TaxID=671267 RepID=R9I8R6_9BACT|nr:hypothetical protein [Phocaeicola sartorii]EOS13047.1 hypothetical protein C802_01792 [Phocaeicola sartorii]MCR1846894.1 hypothetical protein [Phocaeicola sartorii]NUL00136.1 hypothetical protein [Phocaeicola sartorii]